MADIALNRPVAGQAFVAAPLPDDRLVLNFIPGDALLEKHEDNLVFSFDDGAKVVLEGFYTAYSSENMPEFLVGEAIISGEEFFAANEELLPAAGNPSSSPNGSGTTQGFEVGSLLGGIDAENGLDITNVQLAGWSPTQLPDGSFVLESDEGLGTLTVATDGTVTFIPGDNVPEEGLDLPVTFTVRDDDGERELTTDIEIKTPTPEEVTLREVDIPEPTGGSDFSAGTSATGELGFDTTPDSFAWDVDDALTIGEEELTWSLSDDGKTLTAKTKTDGSDVFKVVYNGDATYTVTQFKTIDNGSADDLTESFELPFIASSGNTSVSGIAQVKLVDSTPDLKNEITGADVDNNAPLKHWVPVTGMLTGSGQESIESYSFASITIGDVAVGGLDTLALTTKDADITLYIRKDGADYVASKEAAGALLKLTIEQDGNWEVTQLASLSGEQVVIDFATTDIDSVGTHTVTFNSSHDPHEVVAMTPTYVPEKVFADSTNMSAKFSAGESPNTITIGEGQSKIIISGEVLTTGEQDAKSGWESAGVGSKLVWDEADKNLKVDANKEKLENTEAIVIVLHDKRSATSIDLELGGFFSGNEEVRVEFYNDGEFVVAKSFNNATINGDVANKTFETDSAFDEVRIIPIDGADTSLKSVTFPATVPSSVENVASASGVIPHVNDTDSVSIASVYLSGTEIDLTGLTIEKTLYISEDGKKFVAGTEDTGNTLFTVNFQQDGTWEVIQDQEAGRKLEVAFEIKDSTGSSVTHNILMKGVSLSPENNDYLEVNAANDELRGGDGADYLYGDNNANTLRGEDGADYLSGGKGDDTLYGNKDNDILDGGKGDDTLYGGKNDDLLYGGDGKDTLYGGDGKDALYGGAGKDYLDGGAGADTLKGGAGDDLLMFDAQDLLMDGGDDMDVLLAGVSSLQEVKDAINEGKVTDVEMVVVGDVKSKDGSAIESVSDSFQALEGVSKDAEGTITVNTKKWTQGETANGFEEFTNSSDPSITILVQTNNLGQ